MRVPGKVLAVVLPLLFGASNAVAADRYASPNGTSNVTCGQAQPCDIVTAVNSASTGDTVIVEPGSYTPTMTLDDGAATGGLTIEGQPGAAAPVIDSSAGFAIELTSGSTVSHLDVIDHENMAWGIYVLGKPATIDHVYVQVDGSGSGACYPFGTLTDSICWAGGTNGVGLTMLIENNVSATLRNDTIEALGTGGHGVVVDPMFSPQVMTLNMTNTIAHGTAADLYVGAATGTTATITADHSNFKTIATDTSNTGGSLTFPPAGSGTNQTAAPVFNQPLAGDFHELAGSPTIGAGVDSASNGTTDLEGKPREFAGKTDIGALEYIPPPTCRTVSATTAMGRPVSVALSCTDPLGAALTYSIVHQPSHGTLSTPNAAGTVRYSPAHGYSGADSFTYEARSSNGTSAAATASLTVVAPPRLSHVKLHKRTLQFTLSEAATVTLSFSEHGHTKGTVTLRGIVGANSYRLTGRLSKHKRLTAGKYRVTVTATNAYGKSGPARVRLTIKG